MVDAPDLVVDASHKVLIDGLSNLNKNSLHAEANFSLFTFPFYLVEWNPSKLL